MMIILITAWTLYEIILTSIYNLYFYSHNVNWCCSKSKENNFPNEGYVS
jgi:hypothetical protein